jgi:hypothetical protein
MPPDQQDSIHETYHPFGYAPPVSQLLSLGERSLRGPRPVDYRSFGINESHLDDLARMSRDAELKYAERNTREAWGPTHAMRALIQIGTEATIEPLARLLEYDADADYDDIDDWSMEEIPLTFGKMGEAAIPRCIQLLGNESKHTHSRIAAGNALEKISRHHANTRPKCLSAIVSQLERYSDNDPEWNGWLASLLVDMKAVETAELIQRAFDADMVDETIVGDWDEVQAALGLRPPLTDAEIAEKAKKRQAAHGWISPQEMLDDEDHELLEEMAADWEDSGTEAWSRLAAEPEGEQDDSDDRPRMIMPDEVYSPEQRRELAKQRNKERKAEDRARQQEKRNKRRS